MNYQKIIKYNRNTSRRFGWTPEWFGCTDFDDDLVDSIIEYQKDHKLSPDGMVGSSTHRRIYLERMEDITELEDAQGLGSHIVYAGNFIPIEWDQVILWNHEDGLAAKHGNYRESKELRNPTIFVNHWDVCLTSQMCQNVLDGRNISVHFLIDPTGKIFQTMDMNDIAYHAANANKYSIGVEICNPYYTKYDSWHTKNGLPLRPRWTGTVRGVELEEHLGFYPVQIQACQALWKAVANACDIPLRCPLVDGKMSDRLYEPALNGWKGFVHHYHTDIKKQKIDCGGFDLQKYLGKEK